MGVAVSESERGREEGRELVVFWWWVGGWSGVGGVGVSGWMGVAVSESERKRGREGTRGRGERGKERGREGTRFSSSRQGQRHRL